MNFATDQLRLSLLLHRYLLDEFLNEDLLDFPSASPRDSSRLESTLNSFLFQPTRQFSVHPHEKDILSEITESTRQIDQRLVRRSRGEAMKGIVLNLRSQVKSRAQIVSSISNIDDLIEVLPSTVPLHERFQFFSYSRNQSRQNWRQHISMSRAKKQDTKIRRNGRDGVQSQ